MSDNQPVNRQKGILIVDDTPDNLRLLSQILTEHNYRVRVATSGQQALDSATLALPDLILLDIKMPGMDGFATCTALKTRRETRDIPVLFISALDDVADKVRAFKVGGLDYITKPFQPEEVLARVETHLALHDLQRKLDRANCKMAQELALAGQVQASFLPDKLPQLPGWQFAVTLLPARETSGDFYDVFELPDGRLGIIVADVVDKGVCAALFMALTYALFRTHAVEMGQSPTAVFTSVNHHILHHTHADQFVTTFYGILNPATGTLVYSNAGHCPALQIKNKETREGCWLPNTGVPLGVLEQATWQQEEVLLQPGDTLLIYTDGVIEAQNPAGEFYGRERLITLAREPLRRTAVHLKEDILHDIHRFRAQQHLTDDMVLFIVRRE